MQEAWLTSSLKAGVCAASNGDQTTMTSGGFSYTTFHALLPGTIAKVWRPTLNWENDDWKWFSKNRLHPGVKEALKNF